MLFLLISQETETCFYMSPTKKYIFWLSFEVEFISTQPVNKTELFLILLIIRVGTKFASIQKEKKVR